MTEAIVTEEPATATPQSGLPGGAAPEPVRDAATGASLSSSPSDARPLDYGHTDGATHRARGAWATITGGFWDRIHGAAEFVGMLSAMGALRRLGMGIGLACVLGGIGHLAATFTHYDLRDVHGWGWMAFGGFLVGLCLPSSSSSSSSRERDR